MRLFVHFERVGASSNKCAVLTACSLKLLRTGLGCCSPSPSPNSVTSRKRVEFINLSGLHLTESVSLRNSELKPEPPTCCLLQRSIAICSPDKFEVALHVTSTGHHLMEKAGMCISETQNHWVSIITCKSSTPLEMHSQMETFIPNTCFVQPWP